MVPQAKKKRTSSPIQQIFGVHPPEMRTMKTCRVRPREFQKRSKTHSLESQQSAWDVRRRRQRAERPPIRWGRSLDVAVKTTRQQKTLGPELLPCAQRSARKSRRAPWNPCGSDCASPLEGPGRNVIGEYPKSRSNPSAWQGVCGELFVLKGGW